MIFPINQYQSPNSVTAKSATFLNSVTEKSATFLNFKRPLYYKEFYESLF